MVLIVILHNRNKIGYEHLTQKKKPIKKEVKKVVKKSVKKPVKKSVKKGGGGGSGGGSGGSGGGSGGSGSINNVSILLPDQTKEVMSGPIENKEIEMMKNYDPSQKGKLPPKFIIKNMSTNTLKSLSATLNVKKNDNDNKNFYFYIASEEYISNNKTYDILLDLKPEKSVMIDFISLYNNDILGVLYFYNYL